MIKSEVIWHEKDENGKFDVYPNNGETVLVVLDSFGGRKREITFDTFCIIDGEMFFDGYYFFEIIAWARLPKYEKGECQNGKW